MGLRLGVVKLLLGLDQTTLRDYAVLKSERWHCSAALRCWGFKLLLGLVTKAMRSKNRHEGTDLWRQGAGASKSKF